MDYLTKRFDMIAERILENERLTADLDDEPAQVLLDWGLSSARLIVDSTAGIEDEEEADEVMYARLRANARLMRTVNKWVPKRQIMDELASLKEFGKVGQYVETVYADTFVAPAEAKWQAFLASYQADNDVEMIVKLRSLFESNARSLPIEESAQTEAPTQINEPAIGEAPSEQPPAQAPVTIDESATDEAKSEQPLAEAPATIDEPATEEKPTPQVPAEESAQIDESATDEVPSEQPAVEAPATIDESATEEKPTPQVPAEESAQIDEPVAEETPTPQVPAQESAQIDEPVAEETPSEQPPAKTPAKMDEPVAGETPSEQLPAKTPAKMDEPVAGETPSEQLPAKVPTQTGEPTTDETSTPQVPAQESAQIGEPTTDERSTPHVPTKRQSRDDSKNDHSFGQVPPRQPASSRNPTLQDSKPKSLVSKLWGWATSFFSRR